MRVKLDKESDTLYFRLDENDRVVGVEFLGVSTRATKDELSTMQFQMA
ncbi:MAG: DUF2283 domain-containing protein [Spartobacteria bacterium]|nr:DUF2283 domain-containing protein [Spartobacteria bacterium]